jgi:hypothetical protein
MTPAALLPDLQLIALLFLQDFCAARLQSHCCL